LVCVRWFYSPKQHASTYAAVGGRVPSNADGPGVRVHTLPLDDLLSLLCLFTALLYHPAALFCVLPSVPATTCAFCMRFAFVRTARAIADASRTRRYFCGAVRVQYPPARDSLSHGHFRVWRWFCASTYTVAFATMPFVVGRAPYRVHSFHGGWDVLPLCCGRGRR